MYSSLSDAFNISNRKNNYNTSLSNDIYNDPYNDHHNHPIDPSIFNWNDESEKQHNKTNYIATNNNINISKNSSSDTVHNIDHNNVRDKNTGVISPIQSLDIFMSWFDILSLIYNKISVMITMYRDNIINVLLIMIVCMFLKSLYIGY